MALAERAMQVVQTPLRLVQQATGTDAAELRNVFQEAMRPMRSDIRDLKKQLRDVERKLDEIRDDTQHIRTEQASEQADREG